MIKFFIPLLLISFTCQSQVRVDGFKIVGAIPTPPPPPDTVNIILVTGQSNANSHGQNLYSPSNNFTGSTAKTSFFDSAYHDFQRWNGTNYEYNGWPTQTAQLIQNYKNFDTLYVNKVAQGSLAISNWSDANGSMHAFLDSNTLQSLRSLRSRGKVVRYLSVIWVQGEQDATVGTTQSAYQSKLDSIISRFRRLDASLNNVPWLLVKLGASSGGGTYSPGAVTNINAAMDNLVSAKASVYSVTPESLSVTYTDTVHYTTASYIALANYWYSLIKSLFNW